MIPSDSSLPVSVLHDFLQQRRHDSSAIHSVVIALSAGPDSLAMLLAAQQVAPALGFRVRALHVHHGLHVDADIWAAQAKAQAAAVGIDCQVIKVQIPDQSNIESAARHARYDALADAVAEDEALLLAHHQDDQAETLLLRLMRGAGLQGLTGMMAVSLWTTAESKRLLRWRPWLSVPRQALLDWQQENALSVAAVHDPANLDPRFDRTLLRQQVLPLLQQRWPQASTLLARSAGQLASQAQALNQLADHLLGGKAAGNCLPIAVFGQLDMATQQVVLARWLDQCGVPPMPVRYWPRLHQELLQARADAMPELSWSQVSLRRYRDVIYLLHASDLQPLPETGADWSDVRMPLSWAGRQWSLPLAADDSRVSRHWRIAPRQGGERWRPQGSQHSISVKHWCQDQGIPPWQRLQLACVWADDEVVFLAQINGGSIYYFS